MIAKNKKLSEITKEYVSICRFGRQMYAGTILLNSKNKFSRTLNVTEGDSFCVICYYILGTGHYELANGTTFSFKSGMLCIWPEQNIRRIQHHNKGCYLEKYLSFPTGLCSLLRSYGIGEKPYWTVDPGINPFIASEFDRLAKELQNIPEIKLPFWGLRCCEFLLNLISSFLKLNRYNFSKLEQGAYLLKTEQRLSLSEIALKLNMGTSSFQHLFTQYYGISPIQYQIFHRIDLLKQSLLSGKETLKELALKFGYANEFALSKQFKKTTGYSPREFRNIYRIPKT